VTISISSQSDLASSRSMRPDASVSSKTDTESQIKQRFEQMLWAEMLSHAGLEKAFTLGGGEAASAFSRYVVEEMAKDLAEKHPIGIADRAAAPAAASPAGTGEIES
jgi:hypothetical protein